MSTKLPTTEDIVQPMQQTTRWYYLTFATAASALLLWLVAWAYQLQQGMIVTGLSDWGSGGALHGVIHRRNDLVDRHRSRRNHPLGGGSPTWDGPLHARRPNRRNVNHRGSLRGGFYVLIHMGRPDRMVTSIVGHYHITVNNSPLVWDMTVITAYFVLTATYLGLTLRYDITRLRDQLPSLFEPVYKIMTIGYREGGRSHRADGLVDRAGDYHYGTLLLHGGVIPWLFALLPTYPGWFGAIQGPQFLTIALTSAISGVILVSYAFRRAYDWDHIITDDIFRGLLLWLGFFCLLFLWLQLQQITSGSFFPGTGLEQATASKLSHPMYVGPMLMVLGVLAYIFATTLRPSLFSKGRTIVASLLVLIATLVEKTYFVVAGLWYPTFSIYAATPGEYFPSLIELTSVLGTIGMVTLFSCWQSRTSNRTPRYRTPSNGER
ncbi:dehydrogenase [Natrialba swarupiae]|nr:dehydrogenase [Natrialba swarupiae]